MKAIAWQLNKSKEKSKGRKNQSKEPFHQIFTPCYSQTPHSLFSQTFLRPFKFHSFLHQISWNIPASCAISMELMALFGKPWRRKAVASLTKRKKQTLFWKQKGERNARLAMQNGNAWKCMEMYHKIVSRSTLHSQLAIPRSYWSSTPHVSERSKSPLWKSRPLHFNDLSVADKAKEETHRSHDRSSDVASVRTSERVWKGLAYHAVEAHHDMAPAVPQQGLESALSTWIC